MIDEEIVLFPYITRMEECAQRKRTAEPSGLSSLRGPVATLVFQHDSAGDKLRAIRQASGRDQRGIGDRDAVVCLVPVT